MLDVVEICGHHGKNSVKPPIVADLSDHHRPHWHRSNNLFPWWRRERTAFIFGRNTGLNVMSFFLIRKEQRNEKFEKEKKTLLPYL